MIPRYGNDLWQNNPVPEKIASIVEMNDLSGIIAHWILKRNDCEASLCWDFSLTNRRFVSRLLSVFSAFWRTFIHSGRWFPCDRLLSWFYIAYPPHKMNSLRFDIDIARGINWFILLSFPLTFFVVFLSKKKYTSAQTLTGCLENCCGSNHAKKILCCVKNLIPLKRANL